MIDPERNYQEVTVRMNGKGVIARGYRMGSEMAGDRRLEVRTGQFIISRIDARNGASGIVPEDLNGALVTNDFPVFDCDETRIKVGFLHWLSKTAGFVDACRATSEGSTNRVRLKEDLFANIQIEIPPIADQDRIVRTIKSIAARLEAARQLRQGIQDDGKALLHSVFHRLIKGATYRPLAEVAPIVRRPIEIELEATYEEIGIRSFHKGTFFKCNSLGADISHKSMFQMVPGDLVFSNIMAWEGAIAVVRPEDQGRIGVHRFITCVPHPDIADTNFLWFYFQTGKGFEQIVSASPATIARNRTLSVKKLEAIEVPVPSFEKQQRFAALQQQIAAIHQAQAANQSELDALLPAVLDKAFKGEL
ncbi:restriction endonuclease subunit S [uncultured Thiodictyon sp.]|uniref:restriction endonuclease subunit S n=1 Tax=uncultured Thiodictyon sp. TaxID=1846217 RepID=UPI0025F3E9F2|nr:restriction endonuclease subunit S [uncultured Thiodictyon sp.]